MRWLILLFLFSSTGLYAENFCGRVTSIVIDRESVVSVKLEDGRTIDIDASRVTNQPKIQLAISGPVKFFRCFSQECSSHFG